jgi:hypothetical protein
MTVGISVKSLSLFLSWSGLRRRSEGVRANVAVGAHPVHGTLATVTLAGAGDEAKVHRILAPFTSATR